MKKFDPVKARTGDLYEYLAANLLDRGSPIKDELVRRHSRDSTSYPDVRP